MSLLEILTTIVIEKNSNHSTRMFYLKLQGENAEHLSVLGAKGLCE